MLHLKKIIAGCVIGLGLAGCGDSDSIKCDSKDAMIAFAKASMQCSLTEKGASDLQSKGEARYTDSNSKSFIHNISFKGNELYCGGEYTDGDGEPVNYKYDSFKTISANKDSASCSVKYTDDNGGSGALTFTLKNAKTGLIADSINDAQ